MKLPQLPVSISESISQPASQSVSHLVKVNLPTFYRSAARHPTEVVLLATLKTSKYPSAAKKGEGHEGAALTWCYLVRMISIYAYIYIYIYMEANSGEEFSASCLLA